MQKSVAISKEGISDESSEESDDNNSKNRDFDDEMKFQLSQEIYDMLLRNISPQLDESDNVVIEFESIENKKVLGEIKLEVLKETPNYTSLVVINPKKNSKKANLIIYEEAKSKNHENNLNSHYFEQIGDISIAKIWIKSCILLF